MVTWDVDAISVIISGAALIIVGSILMRKTSLAVQEVNYAVQMYNKVGYEIIDENEEEYIMVCKL